MVTISKINIIGLGPGDIKFLTEKGTASLKKSKIIIGNKRHIESIVTIPLDGKKIVVNKISEINELLLRELTNAKLVRELSNVNIYAENKLGNELGSEELVSVIVSGDTGFYSVLDYIMRNLPEEFHKNIEVIPGISSYQYLFGKLKKCWHDYLLVSAHGRENDYIPYLNFSEKGIVLLTDKNNNWKSISKNLLDNNLNNIKITVGMNLSYSNENIFSFQVEDYIKYEFSTESPAVIILEKRGERDAHI